MLSYIQAMFENDDPNVVVEHLKATGHPLAGKVVKLDNHKSQIVRVLVGNGLKPADVLSLPLSPKLKIEIILRPGVLDDSVLHRIGCDFAEHVLPHFESEYENDSRPRKAIEAKRDWLAGNMNTQQLQEARDAAWLSLSYHIDANGRSAMESASSAVLDAVWCAAMSASRATRALSIADHAAGYDDNEDERMWQVERVREVMKAST